MRKFLFWDAVKRPAPERALPPAAVHVSTGMLFLFTLGVMIGGVVGFYRFPVSGLPADVEAYLSTGVFSQKSLADALWSSSKFFLLLLLLSTSFLGVLLTPAVVFVRGYLLSCSISALFAACSWRGLLWAFLISGLPALFLMPCFLVVACDAFFSAQRLLGLRFRSGPDAGRSWPVRRFAAAALLILLDVLYSFWLLPALLANT